MVPKKTSTQKSVDELVIVIDASSIHFPKSSFWFKVIIYVSREEMIGFYNMSRNMWKNEKDLLGKTLAHDMENR